MSDETRKPKISVIITDWAYEYGKKFERDIRLGAYIELVRRLAKYYDREEIESTQLKNKIRTLSTYKEHENYKRWADEVEDDWEFAVASFYDDLTEMRTNLPDPKTDPDKAREIRSQQIEEKRQEERARKSELGKIFEEIKPLDPSLVNPAHVTDAVFASAEELDRELGISDE